MTRQAGFTLIELLITLVVVGVLTAVAVPAYGSYMLRTRLTDAYAGLAGVQPLAEQYWANEHSFEDLDEAGGFPAATENFTYSLTAESDTAYTVTATGRNGATGFRFTIDQNGRRTSALSAARIAEGWTASNSCWVSDKGGKCSE